MGDKPLFRQTFEIIGGDFINAGEVSSKIKKILREMGVSNNIIRRAAIVTYEAEMNVVLYAQRGTLMLCVTPELLHIKVKDEGNGIADIELALREGYSTAPPEIRELGFGAGMGLPNIKKNSDEFKISSVLGQGTELDIIIRR